MAVLPNRFLVKLDGNVDYFKTYHPHHGIVRLTVEKATGITAPKKKSGVSRLIAKVVKDVPDCYVGPAYELHVRHTLTMFIHI